MNAGHSKKAEIQWFGGGMQQALEAAKSQSKPLFVYWGAVWCPPCNVIKSTVFPDERVVRATARYVSVYLDGDTEEAQSWGERLGASGYPTLMVLDSEGRQVALLSTGITAGEFAETLDRLAGDLLPIEKIVERALAGSATREDWKVITGYSWDQRAVENDALAKASVFEKLEAGIPAEYAVERSRLHLLYLERKLDEDEKAKRDTWDAATREREAARISWILSDPALLRANLQSLAYLSEDLLQRLHPADGPARKEFVRSFLRAMAAARSDGTLSAYEMLVTEYPAVRFSAMKGGIPLEESERQAIRARVLAALREGADEKVHSFTLNSGAYILQKAGLVEEARKLLLENVEKAKAPYYVMASIAELYSDEGDAAKALEWHEKAYRASKGSATRVQWGANYLSALLKARPADKAAITAALEDYFSEHLKASDLFLGRNKSRMGRISKEAGEWASKSSGKAELQALSAKLGARCVGQGAPAAEGFRKACSAYFASFGK